MMIIASLCSKHWQTGWPRASAEYLHYLIRTKYWGYQQDENMEQ
ncbi:MAG: hypothetical protein KL787_08125 [Taibaiella sp.]|nr:hypothetical protein [Taibaiella sp.]